LTTSYEGQTVNHFGELCLLVVDGLQDDPLGRNVQDNGLSPLIQLDHRLLHRFGNLLCLGGLDQSRDAWSGSRQETSVGPAPLGGTRHFAKSSDKLLAVVLVETIMKRERQEVIVATEDAGRQH